MLSDGPCPPASPVESYDGKDLWDAVDMILLGCFEIQFALAAGPRPCHGR